MADMGKTASTSGQDLDVAQLTKDPEKIKILMRRDPRFITRLISQLDKSMHTLLLEKMRRQEEVAAAEKEITQINETIKTHIAPNLERLNKAITTKTELREGLAKQIDASMGNVRNLEQEARALIQKTRHTAGQLMRNTATQRLEEARGFSASAPTTAILKAAAVNSGKPAPKLKPT
ncbi:hypothetical protein Vafri_20666 [Volvox africanus]|uniref:Uncharacterized protein n=1 Tax=Volvox africanus TaxID=51714 RepID=A0A8J4BXE3_9CHLO|nr:hypothetical protein Vafri_20666 [Volvox africanus]